MLHAYKKRELCGDYTEVILYYARLYVFTKKYNIYSLKQLSLYKLQRALTGFTLYEERVGDIVKLIRYSYLNASNHSESVNNLRLLVGHYAACVVKYLAQSPPVLATSKGS